MPPPNLRCRYKNGRSRNQTNRSMRSGLFFMSLAARRSAAETFNGNYPHKPAISGGARLAAQHPRQCRCDLHKLLLHQSF